MKRLFKRLSEQLSEHEIDKIIYDSKNKKEILNSINRLQLKNLIEDDVEKLQDQYYNENSDLSIEDYIFDELCDYYSTEKIDNFKITSIIECCDLDEKWDKYINDDVFEKELYILIVESDIMYKIIKSVAYGFKYDNYDERTHDVNKEISREYDRDRM